MEEHVVSLLAVEAPEGADRRPIELPRERLQHRVGNAVRDRPDRAGGEAGQCLHFARRRLSDGDVRRQAPGGEALQPLLEPAGERIRKLLDGDRLDLGNERRREQRVPARGRCRQVRVQDVRTETQQGPDVGGERA